MENITTKQILYGTAVAVILIGALGLWWYVAQNENVTATQQNGEEQQVATSTDETATTTNEQQENGDESAQEGNESTGQGETDTPVYEGKGGPEETAAQSQQASPLQVQVETPTTQTPVALGERQSADSAAAALKYFAEAMAAKDFERAASYITPHLQAQYQTSFEENYADNQHPLVASYYAGTVDDVELVDPQSGIYEIAVYPSGSQLPFRSRFAFNADMQEFVILEL